MNKKEQYMFILAIAAWITGTISVHLIVIKPIIRYSPLPIRALASILMAFAIFGIPLLAQMEIDRRKQNEH